MGRPRQATSSVSVQQHSVLRGDGPSDLRVCECTDGAEVRGVEGLGVRSCFLTNKNSESPHNLIPHPRGCPVLSQTVDGAGHQVTRVHDGDTLRVRGDSGEFTIRLVGIDAPEKSKKKREPGQPFSQKATEYLAGLVLNQSVTSRSAESTAMDESWGLLSWKERTSIKKCSRWACGGLPWKPVKGFDLALISMLKGKLERPRRDMGSGDRVCKPEDC